MCLNKTLIKYKLGIIISTSSPGAEAIILIAGYLLHWVWLPLGYNLPTPNFYSIRRDIQ